MLRAQICLDPALTTAMLQAMPVRSRMGVASSVSIFRLHHQTILGAIYHFWVDGAKNSLMLMLIPAVSRGSGAQMRVCA